MPKLTGKFIFVVFTVIIATSIHGQESSNYRMVYSSEPVLGGRVESANYRQIGSIPTVLNHVSSSANYSSNNGFIENTATLVTDIEQGKISDDLPSEFDLSQNYPNPFNPSTTIRYSLPEQSDIVLEIFNINGQLVRILANGLQQPGYHSVVWDGTNGAAIRVSSGIYFYRLRGAKYVSIRKMLLIN